jgi:RHS repeat-associated protein
MASRKIVTNSTYDYSGKLITTYYPGNTFSITNAYYPGSNLLHTVTGSNAGDISTVVENGITYNYSYDNLHRLHTETNNGGYGALTMAYDGLGDITTKSVGSTTLSYHYDSSLPKHAVKYINSTSYSFDYDNNGNMTDGWDFSTPSSPKTRTLVYNADNMPTSITYNGSTTSFMYDGTGARAKKTGSTTTYYTGDHYETIGGVATKYIFAGNLRVAEISGSTVSYFHKDHLGSSTVTTNASGAVVESANYEPFGSMRAHTGTTTSSYKFTDQELDGENGLYNYAARLYDPVMGRFITPDSIIPHPYNPQSLNRYSYCLNNPLIYTDPTGHALWDIAVDGQIIGSFWGSVTEFYPVVNTDNSSYTQNSSSVMTGNPSDDEDVSLSQNMSRNKKAVNGYDGVLMAYEICPPEEFDTVEKAQSAMQVDNLMWQKNYGVEFASNVIESKTKDKFTYVIPYYGGTTKDWKYSVSIKIFQVHYPLDMFILTIIVVCMDLLRIMIGGRLS